MIEFAIAPMVSQLAHPIGSTFFINHDKFCIILNFYLSELTESLLQPGKILELRVNEKKQVALSFT